jgi:hypothetical protein
MHSKRRKLLFPGVPSAAIPTTVALINLFKNDQCYLRVPLTRLPSSQMIKKASEPSGGYEIWDRRNGLVRLVSETQDDDSHIRKIMEHPLTGPSGWHISSVCSSPAEFFHLKLFTVCSAPYVFSLLFCINTSGTQGVLLTVWWGNARAASLSSLYLHSARFIDRGSRAPQVQALNAHTKKGERKEREMEEGW